MMAGSRTFTVHRFTVLPFVFLMLLMRCDGNLQVHLQREEATVTSIMCNDTTKDTHCVTVNVTECPVTAHVCSDGEKMKAGGNQKKKIPTATRNGCPFASRGGFNEKGLPFIEVFVDSANLSLTKQAECTYNAKDTTPALVSHFNATKMTFCAGDAVCTGHHNVTDDYGVCHGSIRDIAFRLAGDKQIALTPEISSSTPSFKVFYSSSLDTYSFYKSTFTSRNQGAMVEVYILGTLDYQVHIDTETGVCVIPAREIEPTGPGNAEEEEVEPTRPNQLEQVQSSASIAKITVPICLLAVICVIVILAFFFRKRRLSRRLDVPDDSHEAISLQTVTTSNG